MKPLFLPPGRRIMAGIALMILVVVSGCHTSTPNSPPTRHSEFRREHDPAFSTRERELITAASHRLEQIGRKPIDVFYRVRPMDSGCEVFVLYVTAYEGGKPVFRPCNDCAVRFSNDGTVREVLTGPAAWP